MEQSPEIDQLAAALVKARAAFGPVHKDSANPHFKSSFASLGAICSAVLPALTANDIAVIQSGDNADDAGTEVATRLLHVSGQWIETRVRMPMDKANPQGAGSALTYGRRYGLSAALCLVADEDDDGNAASAPKAPSGDSRAKTGPLTLPGKKTSFGGHGGKPLADCPTKVLAAFASWAGEEAERAAKFKAEVDAATAILEDRREAGDPDADPFAP